MKLKYTRLVGSATFDDDFDVHEHAEVYLLDITNNACTYLVITEYHKNIVQRLRILNGLKYFIIQDMLYIILFDVIGLENEDDLVNYDIPIVENVFIKESLCISNVDDKYKTLAIYRIDNMIGTCFKVTEVRVVDRVTKESSYSISEKLIGPEVLFSKQLYYDEPYVNNIVTNEVDESEFKTLTNFALQHLQL